MCLETIIVPSKCVNIGQLFSVCLSSCPASSNDFLISKQSKTIYGCVRTVLSCQLCPNKLTDLSVRCTLKKNEQKWKIEKIVDRFVSLIYGVWMRGAHSTKQQFNEFLTHPHFICKLRSLTTLSYSIPIITFICAETTVAAWQTLAKSDANSCDDLKSEKLTRADTHTHLLLWLFVEIYSAR